MRKVWISKEMSELVKKTPGKKIAIYGFFPCDQANCACQPLILKWKKDLLSMSNAHREQLMAKTKFLKCPRSKKGLNRYKISCRVCGEVQGYCWASDKTLKDWCDFHYVQWTKGEQWHGCLTPHISPITQELCLECCCGNDSRDFKANMTLPTKVADSLEASNKVGREFGKKNSKFIVRKVKATMIPFSKK